MRIHSSTLGTSDFFAAAGNVSAAAPNIYVDSCSVHGSRKRSRGFEVALRGRGAHHTRRPNSGKHGATSDNSRAATYDDWGFWLAELYRLDPEMIAAYYGGADDFHAQTDYKYSGS